MLSLPAIKDIIKSFDGRRHPTQIDCAKILDAEGHVGHDTKSYLVYLATNLAVDVLVFIKPTPSGKSARLIAAGQAGLTTELTMPSLENGNTLSGLIESAQPARGKAKVFLTTEVFPCDATWCDFIPMDSTVSYCFLPIRSLPVTGEARRPHDVHEPDGFVLGAETDRPGEGSMLELKTLTCASLLNLSMTHRRVMLNEAIISSAKDFLYREGYSLYLVGPDGRPSWEIGKLPSHTDEEALKHLCQRIRPSDQSLCRPEMVTEDMTISGAVRAKVFAYPLAAAQHLIFLKRCGPCEETDVRKERLKLLSRITSSIAHEVKNPLTGIAAGIQYLSKKLQPGVTESDTVEFILTEVARLNRIVDDLYKISKPPQLMLARININDVVGKSLLCLSGEVLKKRLTVEQDLRKDIPTFEADSDRLQQVLINIIKNGIEASPENGKVKVSTRWEGEEVTISVADSGQGITREEIDRIFEPFYSTKSGGTGLGLCVCHSIVEQHGGRIDIESPPEGGARFMIRLPLRG